MGIDRYYDAQEEREAKRHDQSCPYRKAIEIFTSWPFGSDLGLLFLKTVLERRAFMDRSGTVRYPACDLVMWVEELIKSGAEAEQAKRVLETKL